MKISVVTASFNSEATIGFTIESFLKQSHPDKEMLVIDGASRDGTLKIVESFGSDAIRVFSEPDKGVYDAMNKGFRLFAGRRHRLPQLRRHVPRCERARRHRRRPCRCRYRLWRPQHGDRSPHQADRRGCGAAERSTAIRFSLAGCRRIRPSTCAGRWRKRSATTICATSRPPTTTTCCGRLRLNDFRVRYIPRVIADFQMGGISTRGLGVTIRGNLECLRSRREHLNAPVIDAAFFLRFLRRIFQIRRSGF